ncbi:thiamine phosphate synthase [Microbacterium sp. HA-8]|uniref:thiamine phosphate synthase n=1 Tax=Microbacterium sp. HA-8 TaxID=3234200 RepID=UPI0038F78D4B
MNVMSSQLYLCTDARTRQGDFAHFVDAAFSGGVDIIQLRDKTLEAAPQLRVLEVLKDAAERHGKLWAVNDRADVAAGSGSPILHLGQDDLPLPAARSLLGSRVTLGLSTHTTDQVDRASADPEADYFCVGPVWATPTKPGRDAVGTELVDYAASVTPGSRTWFAIGGIDLTNVEQVVEAGARRVVVVRAVTDAKDPFEAAQALRAALPALTT